MVTSSDLATVLERDCATDSHKVNRLGLSVVIGREVLGRVSRAVIGPSLDGSIFQDALRDGSG